MKKRKPYNTSNRRTINPRIRDGIARATALLAQARTMREAAAAIDSNADRLRDWRCRHAALWKTCLDRAMQDVTAAVRQVAGSTAVLSDPEKYLGLAKAADKYLRGRGEDLFPANGRPTLSSFYSDVYEPRFLSDATEGTRVAYRCHVRAWSLLTADPPLEEIRNETVETFRDAMGKLRGADKIGRRSPNSVRSVMRSIGTLLSKAGPPGPRNRDALGLIDRVPWARPPRAVLKIPNTISIEVVDQLCRVVSAAERPQIEGVKPPQWWKALIAVACSTGLRIGTLLALEMVEIDWKSGQLVISAEKMKARRPHLAYLNEAALHELRAIRTDRRLVFPWPHCKRYFDQYLRGMQRRAGVPESERVTFHAIRRSFGTALAGVSLDLARLALGHQALQTTLGHYIGPVDALRAAVAQVPMPATLATSH